MSSVEESFNLALDLHRRGRLQEAEAQYCQVVSASPNHAVAYYLLGVLAQQTGRTEFALDSIGRAIAIKPDYAEAHCDLGTLLHAAGRFGAAEASYRRALDVKPDLVQARIGLGFTLRALGCFAEAMSCCLYALGKTDSPDARKLFVYCADHAALSENASAMRMVMERALSEPWDRPLKLSRNAAALTMLDPDIRSCAADAAKAWPQRLPAMALVTSPQFAAIAANRLLRTLLTSTPVCHVELEYLLTSLRRALLRVAVTARATAKTEQETLTFCAALAQQCFINEYLFALTDEETQEADGLRRTLNEALEQARPVNPIWIAAVAAYLPLHSLPYADDLLQMQGEEAIGAVIVQQIVEPAEERALAAAMPRLSAIDDPVSLAVQAQYETNPYPRWIKTAPPPKAPTFDHYLRRTLPLGAFRPLGERTPINILIAGCGTGQQPIEAAFRHPGARILAIDLSLASLGYAQRKSRQLGVGNIDFARADILNLERLGRSFEVIECVGVLHHLADPFSGWRALLPLLGPGGFMRIGLYSALARQDVRHARMLAAQGGYDGTAESMRHFRHYLISRATQNDFTALVTSGDFFSASACRDLLFHVEEHTLTLPEIDRFLKENDLRFVGFDVDARVLHAYKLRFPGDATPTNLDHWEILERDNPDTFAGMYQFWIQNGK